MLKVFNTLTGRKDPFEPLTAGQVRMYVCGVTVYDDSHLGHARSAVVFDVIRRYLEHRGYAVTFVKNFTDVDDKIIRRANQLGIPWQDVTARYIDAYYRDMGRLGVLKATEEPKATDHMGDIIGLISRLIEKGVAYRVNGDVYFQVEKYPAYGRLSKRKLDEMQAGARVEVDERKRNPVDFALWKAAKPDEPFWESPWGRGRPGWHIECSAMAMHYLGETFDLHGGGQDLIFPHHENEIAQSCAATGKEFARVWVHNGFVTLDQEKMSKSLGNFFTVQEIFEKFPLKENEEQKRIKVVREVVRYFLLSTQYRGPIDFSDEALRQAWAGLDNFYGLLLRLDEKTSSKEAADGEVKGLLSKFTVAFEQAMDDDFNTPVALAEFHRLRGEVNSRMQELSQDTRTEVREAFRRFGQVLGLFQVSWGDWRFAFPGGDDGYSLPFQPASGGDKYRPPQPPNTDDEVLPFPPKQAITDDEIEQKIAERNKARQQKDFVKADEIRKALAVQGIFLEDKPDGTTRWKR